MADNGKYDGTAMEPPSREPPSLRWGSHKRLSHTVNFDPALFRWIERETVAQGLSFSEVVNRELRKQHDLRQQLSALTSIDPERDTPVFQVLLQQHGQKVSKTVDGAVQGILLLQQMLAAFARVAMSPEQLSNWERAVFGGKGKA